ncbi:hypothetical protein J6590_084962 [Homalodisca vitripennis]|nr:hypothetical protein J6590_084962 [Homalodisca vitripennis]
MKRSYGFVAWNVNEAWYATWSAPYHLVYQPAHLTTLELTACLLNYCVAIPVSEWLWAHLTTLELIAYPLNYCVTVAVSRRCVAVSRRVAYPLNYYVGVPASEWL